MMKRIITRVHEKLFSFSFEKQTLKAIQYIDETNQGRMNSIYSATIKNIVPNIQSAFVEIENGEICHYSLKNANPFFIKRMSPHKICIGDEIVVQLNRERIKTKSATVTDELTLAGQYAVAVYGMNTIRFSSKINDSAFKETIRENTKELLSENIGFIVRTEALLCDNNQLLQEMIDLKKALEAILETSLYRMGGTKIHEGIPEYITTLQNEYDTLEEIITDEEAIYLALKGYERLFLKTRLYKDSYSLKALYNLEHELEQLLQKKVWLSSGAYLVIEQTESLVAIDVNTGKAIHKKSADFFFEINKEAVNEIVRQIHLRELSGIIMIDFINMPSDLDEESLLKITKEKFNHDSTKTIVHGFTKLKLMEISRQKKRQSLQEQLKQKVVDTHS